MIERIKKKFAMGGHKAYGICKVAKEKEIILISSLSKEQTEGLFMRKMDSVEEAMKYAEKKHDRPNYILMPYGSLTVPVLSE